jgi:NAD(P)H-quinone oxidoreductase subunit 5
MTLCGVAPSAKPGGYLLGALLCLALVKRLAYVLRIGDAEAALFGLATTGGLCLTYGLAFRTIDALAGRNLPALPASGAATALGVVVGAVFVGLWALESVWADRRGAKWLQALYVHAANGFYVDAFALRAARAVRE